MASAHVGNVCQLDPQVANDIVQAAYAARRDKMLEKFLNTRIMNIKKAGGNVDAGAIAVEANNSIARIARGARQDSAAGHP